MGDGTSDGCSSSSDKEEDANWKAAIESIAATTTFGSKVFGSVSNGSIAHSKTAGSSHDHEDPAHDRQKLKHYQIKAQKLLDQMLENTLEIVRDANRIPYNDVIANEGGVRLFKKSAVGIIFDHADEIQGSRKRPRILPGEYVHEHTTEFRRRLRAVAVDGTDIITTAKDASQKLLATLEAKEAAAKEKVQREEERVAELKRIRGERWLPCMAREMKKESSPFLPEDWDESSISNSLKSKFA